MQALLLAAGMGKRLGRYTNDGTKCMVRVNGISLIERTISALVACNIQRFVIVVGYKGDILKEFIAQKFSKEDLHGMEIEYIENPVYDKTNNIYSLYLARDYLLAEDTMLFESDTIFEDRVIESLYSDKRETLALVDKYESWMDGTVVRISPDDEILDVIPGKEFNFSDTASYYKTVNVYKFSKSFSEQYYVPFLEAYIHAVGNSVYYENVLRILTMLDNTGIHAVTSG